MHHKFSSWGELRTHIDLGRPVYYWAPLDPMPHRVRCVNLPKNIRVFPPTKDADPFNADITHLDRFRRLYK